MYLRNGDPVSLGRFLLSLDLCTGWHEFISEHFIRVNKEIITAINTAIINKRLRKENLGNFDSAKLVLAKGDIVILNRSIVALIDTEKRLKSGERWLTVYYLANGHRIDLNNLIGRQDLIERLLPESDKSRNSYAASSLGHNLFVEVEKIILQSADYTKRKYAFLICVELSGSMRYLSAGQNNIPIENFRDIDLVFHIVDSAKRNDIHEILDYFRLVFNKEALSLGWRIEAIDLTANNRIIANIVLRGDGLSKTADIKLRFWKHKSITLKEIKEIHRLYLLKRFGENSTIFWKRAFVKNGDVVRWDFLAKEDPEKYIKRYLVYEFVFGGQGSGRRCARVQTRYLLADKRGIQKMAIQISQGRALSRLLQKVKESFVEELGRLALNSTQLQDYGLRMVKRQDLKVSVRPVSFDLQFDYIKDLFIPRKFLGINFQDNGSQVLFVHLPKGGGGQVWFEIEYAKDRELISRARLLDYRENTGNQLESNVPLFLARSIDVFDINSLGRFGRATKADKYPVLGFTLFYSNAITTISLIVRDEVLRKYSSRFWSGELSHVKVKIMALSEILQSES
ncbi:MAG: hypothetical protein ACYDFR_06670, partial [Candidatus Omnitrophota bacterium]